MRTDVHRHDADAGFKQGVSRPSGGNGKPSPQEIARRPELHHDERFPGEIRGPAEVRESDGWAGDCELVAVLGAVAAHRPANITDRIREQANGSYRVTLSEARQTRAGAVPTGRNFEFNVTPDLPVYDDDPDAPAAAEAKDDTAWCPVMKKAFAGLEKPMEPHPP